MIKHILHIDEYPLEGNPVQAIDLLYDMVEAMTGKEKRHLHVSTKYDGAPAIVFGVHPENGKLFCGTKSVFNKRIPKIAYSENDINELYGDKPELATKLRRFFYHFENTIDKDEFTGVYQGDLMYTADSTVVDSMMAYFTPNTITYCCAASDPMYQIIHDAQVGIAIHTRYEGDTIQELKSVDPLYLGSFVSGEIHWIDPRINLRDYRLTEIQAKVCDHILNGCEFFTRKINNYSVIFQHSKMMKQFMNYCVRIGETDPNIPMYEKFLQCKGETELLKTYNNKNIMIAMGISVLISKVKKIIMNVLDQNSDFFHEINGEPTSGEGYVITYHGVKAKLVDRVEFSRKNFANKRFQNAS